MLLLVAKGIPANLQQVAILKHAVVNGLPGPKHRSRRLEHHTRTADVDHGMPGKNVRILWDATRQVWLTIHVARKEVSHN